MNIPTTIRELYPFESRYLTIGGQRLHYIDEGQGPAVVLLHGNPTWSFYYRELIKGLRDRYRVIAPDHMGCGLSEKPQRYSYSLQRHIDNLDTLLSRLAIEGPLTLGMHDWGGPIGVSFALRHPQRIGRLIVFNTSVFLGDIPLRIRLCTYPLIGPLVVRWLNGFVRGALAVGCADRARMTPQVRAGYLHPYRQPRDRAAVLGFVQEIPRRRGHPNRSVIQELDRSLPRLRERPAIVLWGGRDFCFTQAYLEGWVERLPAAEVHLFEDAGHLVVEDAHERIRRRLRRFLERTAHEASPPPAAEAAASGARLASAPGRP
jgi:haloalkane dehalogenase